MVTGFFFGIGLIGAVAFVFVVCPFVLGAITYGIQRVPWARVLRAGVIVWAVMVLLLLGSALLGHPPSTF